MVVLFVRLALLSSSLGGPRRRLPVLQATDARKRVGDAVILSGLSVYQQAIVATSALAPVTVNLGSACIRGCRLTICLFAAERFFKCLRAPTSQREVPVPVEAAALALCVNFALEYNVVHAFESLMVYMPDTLAMSLGGTPADVTAAYLTIVVWRTIYASLGGGTW